MGSMLLLGPGALADKMLFADAVQQQAKTQRELEAVATPNNTHGRRTVQYWGAQKKGLESLANKTYDTSSAHAADEKDDAYYQNQDNFVPADPIVAPQTETADSDGEADDDAAGDDDGDDDDDDAGDDASTDAESTDADATVGNDDGDADTEDAGDDDDDDDDGEGDTGDDDDDDDA